MTGDRSAKGGLAASRAIYARQQALAEQVVARQYAQRPGQWATYGEEGRAKSVRDVRYHLAYLSEAVAAEDASLFRAYVSWVQTLFAGLEFDEGTLMRTLRLIDEALGEALDDEHMSFVRPALDAGLKQAAGEPALPPSHLPEGAPLSSLARAYLDALLGGDRRAASHLILDAAEAGTPVQDLYLHVFQPVQREVGRLWQISRLSVAQEHYVTAATQLIMSQLYPRIFSTTRVGRCLVATCVGGELHEIGVRMVADLFEMAGWDSYYLGANTPAQGVLQAIEERQPDVLAISATLTVHVSQVRGMIERVRLRAAARAPLILVGGYPFLLSPELWRRVGADGYAADAQQAVQVANELVDARLAADASEGG
jgi:methanogenic corrinoid protein MtbC1